MIFRPTDTCYVYEQNDEQWQMLPSLPNPLCGENRNQNTFFNED
jgi:hypothetical protein